MHLIKGPYVLIWYFSLHASFYILFSLWTWSFSVSFSIMTSPCYCDVTHLLTDPNENCTGYVKLEIKGILFMRIFWFSEYLLRKLRLITKIPSIVQLPYTLPPIPYGPPIWMCFVRDTSLAYLRIHFQHQKQKNNNSFYLNWWKPGSIPITPPPSLAPH